MPNFPPTLPPLHLSAMFIEAQRQYPPKQSFEELRIEEALDIEVDPTAQVFTVRCPSKAAKRLAQKYLEAGLIHVPDDWSISFTSP